MRELLTGEQYQAGLLALVRSDTRSEPVPLAAGRGRVLAADTVAGDRLPVRWL